MNTAHRSFGPLLAVALLALLGCSHETTKPATTPSISYLPQDSPANVLANLEHAYVDRDATEFAKLFTSDFTMVFYNGLPWIPNLPPSWGTGDENRAAARMFLDEQVRKITLSFNASSATSSNEEHEATWKIRLTRINLRVETKKSDGTALVYRVLDGEAAFYFKEYSTEQASNGRPLWRIWQWEDRPLGKAMSRVAPATTDTTWGEIKNLYR